MAIRLAMTEKTTATRGYSFSNDVKDYGNLSSYCSNEAIT